MGQDNAEWDRTGGAVFPDSRLSVPAPTGGRHAVDYFFLLRSRLTVVCSVFLLVVLLTAWISYSTKPVYRAETLIAVEPDLRRSPLSGELTDPAYVVSEQVILSTHVGMVTSRPVLERVAKDFKVVHDPPYRGALLSLSNVWGRMMSALAGIFESSPEPPSTKGSSSSAVEDTLHVLKEKIHVEEVRNTRLLRIRVEDHNPAAARDLANRLAEAYIAYDSDMRTERARKSIEWLSREFSDIGKRLEESQSAFLDFKERESVFSIEGKQGLSEDRIREMNAELLAAGSRRRQLDTTIRELEDLSRSGNRYEAEGLTGLFQDNLLATLQAELVKTEVERKRLSQVYKHKHPEMVKVDAKLQELRRRIAGRFEQVLENLKSERAALLNKEKAIKEALSGYEAEALAMNRKGARYSQLEQELRSDQELVNLLRARIREMDLEKSAPRPVVRLVEAAELPKEPVKPNTALNLLLGVVLGGLLGVGAGFLAEYLDRTIRGLDDVERHLGVDVLSEVPRVKGPSDAKEDGNGLRFPSVSRKGIEPRFAEAFRRLAFQLGPDRRRSGSVVHLISSSAATEGKSTVALNLGMALARMGRKTLVLEADLHMPGFEARLGLDPGPGLAEVLGEVMREEVTAGTLRTRSPGDLHVLLRARGCTGMLIYRDGDQSTQLTFIDGLPVSLKRSPELPEATMTGLLLAAGRISRSEANAADSVGRLPGPTVEQRLIQTGILTPEELAAFTTQIIKEAVGKLNGELDIRYEFRPEDSLTKFKNDPSLNRFFQSIEQEMRWNPGKPEHLLNTILGFVRSLPYSGAHILSAGTHEGRPSDLFTDGRFEALLGILSWEFDHILVDTPPVGNMNDALMMAPFCDGIIVVIRAGRTHVDEVLRTLREFSVPRPRILGVVVNMMNFKKDHYYYGRYLRKYDKYYRMESKRTSGSEPG